MDLLQRFTALRRKLASRGRHRASAIRPIERLEERALLSDGAMGGHGRMATYPGNSPAGPSQVQRVDRPVELQELVGVGVAFKRPHYYEAFNAIGSRPDLNAVKLTARVNPRMGLVLTGWMQGRIKVNPATASQQAFYVFG